MKGRKIRRVRQPSGHKNVVAKLIAAGADVDRQHNFGKTALDLAKQYGEAGVVKQLEHAELKRKQK